MSENDDVSKGDVECGYLLLEVLIGVAISSTLIYLLLASLNSLSRSQERTLNVIEDISTRVFSRELTSQFFGLIKPTYRSDGDGFRGDPSGFSGRSFLDGVGGLRGTDVTVSLVRQRQGLVLMMTSEDQSFNLMHLDSDKCRFDYLPLEGAYSGTWLAVSDNQIPRDGSDPHAYFTRYAHPVPRQIRLHCSGERGERLVGAWPLGANDWPMPRELDLRETLPF